jgi:vacuolar-type H+-ATPase subunit I/STV1
VLFLIVDVGYALLYLLAGLAVVRRLQHLLQEVHRLGKAQKEWRDRRWIGSARR